MTDTLIRPERPEPPSASSSASSASSAAPGTLAGSVSLPLVVNVYGARRSRLGVVAAVRLVALKRGTLTPRTALAVWPAESTATTTSVSRPTSAAVGR